jgi:ribosomal protein S25
MTNDLVILNFAEARQPEYREKKGSGYIEFGERNDYPSYLLSLYNKSAKHNAIVRGKVNYIIGNGWATKEADPIAESFIKKVNSFDESLNDLTRKVDIDIEIFGGAFLEIIWSEFGGQLTDINHIDYTRIRSNKDNTSFWYKQDWNDRKEREEVLPAFSSTLRQGKQILYIKEYRPGLMTYALPGYMGALNYIESDIEVSRHVLGNAQTGFSASKLITLPNGEPTPDEKRNIEKRFENRFTGSDGKKFILSFVQNADRKPIVEDLGASDLTKEDFGRVDTMIQQNIFAGHQITTPSLFGIAEPGKLGSRTEMRDGFEIFKSTYVNDKQQFLESIFNMLARLKGATEEIYIKPIEPISFEFSEQIIAQVAPKEWILEKIGIDASKYLPVPDGAVAPQDQAVNEHLKGMKGREWQNMQRIIREFMKGKINRDQATAMLKGGYALSDDEVNTWLGEDEQTATLKFSEDEVIGIFAQFGESAENYSTLKKKNVKFSLVDSMDDDEIMSMQFASVVLSDLEKNVIDLVTKDKRITPEVLANVTKTEIAIIINIMERLAEAGILKQKVVGGVIEREPVRPLSRLTPGEPAQTTSFKVMYSYDWDYEKLARVGGSANSATSRPFCKRLMAMNKVYSRSDIQQITARLGYSVFDRRGGWWTMPTGQSSPACRHTWVSNIVIKK